MNTTLRLTLVDLISMSSFKMEAQNKLIPLRIKVDRLLLLSKMAPILTINKLPHSVVGYLMIH